MSERGQEETGVTVRGVKKSKDSERAGSGKVRILSERGQEK